MTARLSGKLTRIVVGAVVVAVVVGVGLYLLLGNGGTKKVTADFSSAVGVYTGTPVEILGVKVGEVTKVTPKGDHVAIEMNYDSKYKVPKDAISVVVASSLVSDRYLQLAPAYSGSGPTLADGATIPMSRTASPAELDDIYAALDKLSVSLGPKGANKTGALNDLVKVASANLKGEGADLGNSITALSKAATTLSNGRGDLFTTVKNLQVFTKALSASDAQVRHFEDQLAQVSSDLVSERADLGAALHNLANTLDSVNSFIKDNAGKFHTDITGLEVITNILIKEKASLNETFAVAPAALANIVHAYDPQPGVIATRSNLSSLTDPAQFCNAITGLVNTLTKGTPLSVLLGPGGVLGGLLGAAAGTVVNTCLKATGGKSTATGLPTDPNQLAQLLQSILNGGLGGLIGAGG